ncbi:prolipoprotein diacylglyceryl transferase [Ostreiculturibacter nitratireducens]|uniref:prolipoprotein diacylglyceryl transferase n=1 Tax=Ostreiculturibacter nitratireducens TaxID=3075226 RepID=UPI0031B585AD
MLVHDFDPEIVTARSLSLYWYGAVYTLGFLGFLTWFAMRRNRLGLSGAEVLDLCILLAALILVGGRLFDILVYEFDYYRENPRHMIDWWRGGMASHGVLLGALAAVVVFSVAHRKPALVILDEMVVPGVFLLAVGRLGNFIEGGVVGGVTALPWGVLYPDLEGPRHPVALYESVKNFAILPILALSLRRWPAGTGVTLSLFVFLYAALRFAVDQLRDYEATWLGIGTGQWFNLGMAAAGLFLLALFRIRPLSPPRPFPARPHAPGFLRIALMAFLIAYPLGIPTSWTLANIEEMRRERLENPAEAN